MKVEYNYGYAYKKYPIKENQVGIINNGQGKIKVHDIYNKLPSFMLSADLVISDPPWNLGNVNTFYTKANKKGAHSKKYNEFIDNFFNKIDIILPNIIYIEIGNQYYKRWMNEVKERFGLCQVWDITYYKKNPCKLIRGSKISKTNFDFEGMDEWDAILKACEIENYSTVADLCMGRGLVGLGAFESGHNFVGTELNHKRLSVLIEKLVRKGASLTYE